MKRYCLRSAILSAVILPCLAWGQGKVVPVAGGGVYGGWKFRGKLTILTTPEGADLPASAVETDFPMVVRLDKDWFPFSQAKSGGEDVRFSSVSGEPLSYEIEEWDAVKGRASIWVKIPKIRGNERQELVMSWGKADVASESKGGAVFGEGNGYVAVMHMGEGLADAVGTVKATDLGTTRVRGMIGEGRGFVPGKGITGGKNVVGLPFGDNPLTYEAWFRAETTDCYVLYYGRYATRLNGKTGDGNEVGVSVGSPARLGWASDGPGGVGAETIPVMGQWYHVAAMYENGISQIFVNGKLDGVRKGKAAMSVMKEVSMEIGGMRGGSYRFGGEIDEVRVSKVGRSADWMRLEYENQKSTQSLVGPLVQSGSAFGLSVGSIRVEEGKSVTVVAKAGGAEKVSWVLKRDGVESVVAVDRFSYQFEAGRVRSTTAMSLQFKAVYPSGVKVLEIPVTVVEAIPEPVVSLKAPKGWNGRDRVEILPVVSNGEAMKAKGAGELKTVWRVEGGAVLKEVSGEKLILKRSQMSGKITVKMTVSNGGAESEAEAVIEVTEPKTDAWVERIPGKEEQPEEKQFYARNDRGEGRLFYNGKVAVGVESVFLRLYADEKLVKTEVQKPKEDGSYGFSVGLKAGMIGYKVEFGTKTGGVEKIERTVGDLICGDAYIIEGQSNAEASGPNNGPTVDAPTRWSRWVRSYGNSLEGSVKGGWGDAVRTRIWGKPDYGFAQIGTWGMVLANGLVEKYGIPICVMNGAYGGTPIFLHQRNPANHFDTSGAIYGNPYKIYGGLLTRVTGAKLTHGIRGVIWHQGENDQGSGAPTGDYNWKSYQDYFVEMSAAWKEDFPNIQNYYIFQIWPSGCNMGGTNAGDMLLEVQRTLPRLFSKMRVMSTLGIVSKSSGRGLCHFDQEGYAQIAQLMSPVIEQDHYGLDRAKILTAPNLVRAYFTNGGRKELVMEFDQPMVWKEENKAWIELDGKAAGITGGKAEGNRLVLGLDGGGEAKKLGYLSGKSWDGKADRLIYGVNGIAALSFSGVEIGVGVK